MSLDVVTEVVDAGCVVRPCPDGLSFVNIAVFHQLLSDGSEVYWMTAHNDREILPMNWIWTEHKST